jgi:hypothetical protein
MAVDYSLNPGDEGQIYIYARSYDDYLSEPDYLAVSFINKYKTESIMFTNDSSGRSMEVRQSTIERLIDSWF